MEIPRQITASDELPATSEPATTTPAADEVLPGFPSWTEVLTRIDADVTHAENLTRQLPDGSDDIDVDNLPLMSWQPPVSMGPIPADLEEYARSVLSRQARIMELISNHMDNLRKQMRAAHAHQSAEPATAIYLDTSA